MHILCINRYCTCILNLVSSPSPPPTANSVIMCHYFLSLTCSFGGNQFGDDGLQAVAEGIENCRELKQLQ